MSLARPTALVILPFLLMLAPRMVQAQLSLSVTFNSNASGITLGASGSSAASMAFGTVAAYGGTLKTGVTRTVNGSSNWTLSTPFNINVGGLGIINPTYTLTARLGTADAVHTWKINSANLSGGALMTLTTTATYNTSIAYTFSLTIPFSEAPGTLSNTLYFTATGN